MRLVIDTDVLVAAIRSPTGASATLIVHLLERQQCMLLSVALAFEYEAVAMRAEHRLAANAAAEDIQVLLNTIMDVVEPVEVHYQWRPQLSDAADEMVLEAAVNGKAEAIVTFNHKHFSGVAERFGIEILSPSEVLRRIRQ